MKSPQHVTPAEIVALEPETHRNFTYHELYSHYTKLWLAWMQEEAMKKPPFTGVVKVQDEFPFDVIT